MSDALMIVFDCGSTNLTVAAVDEKGNLVASAARANAAAAQAGGEPGWRVWDRDGIWEKLCDASREVTGEMSIDATGASTTMAMDLGGRAWSDWMLGLAGLDASFFPRWVEPGERVGAVSVAAERCGLPVGCPLFAGGHDTQFAVLGSG